MNVKQKLVTASMGVILAAGSFGCSTNAGTGALVGGAAGAGVGAIIGHNSHGRTASGAAIGGAVGAVTGALIGNEIDKKEAREADRETVVVQEAPPPVVVERRVIVERRPGYWTTRRYVDGHGRIYERRIYVEY
jgi:outer membrane lipoprotein SlyB